MKHRTLFSILFVVLSLVVGTLSFRLNDGIRVGSRCQPNLQTKVSTPLIQTHGREPSNIRHTDKLARLVRYPIHLRGGASVVLSAATASPALSVWAGPAFACALSYALYNLFIKKASASMDPILGGVLLQIVAASLGAALLAVQRARATAPLEISKLGIKWAIAAGAAVGAAEILSFIISGLGVPASKSIPAIIGGSVVMGTLLGALWLGEKLTARGWGGIVLIAIGIALVGMDPGASLH